MEKTRPNSNAPASVGGSTASNGGNCFSVPVTAKFLLLLVFFFSATASAAPAPIRKPKPKLIASQKSPSGFDIFESTLARFPSSECCAAWIEFAEQHYRWAWNRGQLYTWERQEWEDYSCQVWQLRNIWISLRIAKDQSYSLGCRLEELQKVRDAIGETAWRHGFMPAPLSFGVILLSD